MTRRLIGFLFLIVGLAGCSWEPDQETITIEIANHRSGTVVIDGGFLPVEIPGKTSRGFSCSRGDTLFASDKTTDQDLSSRSFYSSGTTWDIY